MSKRLTGIKGKKTGNRGFRNRCYKNYMGRLSEAQRAASEDTLETIKGLYVQARRAVGKFVPKGSSKLLRSIVRQRT